MWRLESWRATGCRKPDIMTPGLRPTTVVRRRRAESRRHRVVAGRLRLLCLRRSLAGGRSASRLVRRRELDRDLDGLTGLHGHVLRAPPERLVPCLDGVAPGRHGLDACRAARVRHTEVRMG